MFERDNSLLLKDILDAAQKILSYTNSLTFEDFMSDERTKDAVVRNFEIIGEAAKRITEEFKIKNINVPWRRMTGFRNRIIHEYFGIDFEILWQIKQENLPDLILMIKEIELE